MKHKCLKFQLLIVVAITATCANASTCTTESMKEIVNNETLTSIQKEHQLHEMCLNQEFSVVGAVTDVRRKGIRLLPVKGDLVTNDEDGHYFELADNHNCGNLLSIQLGDVLELKGTTTRVYGALQVLHFSNSVCVSD